MLVMFQAGNIYIPVSKEKQKESLAWLQKNAFETQDWLLNKNILTKFKEDGYTDLMLNLQNRQLNSILNSSTLKRMIDAEVIQDDFYAASDMIRDLRTGIFMEANYVRNVDLFRRNLQKSFIDRLGVLLVSKETKNTDITSIIRGELEMMNFQLTIAKNRGINRMTKYHYRDCLAAIQVLLNPKN